MSPIDFQIDQAAFSDALDTVRRAISGKSTLPILETIRIEASGGEVTLAATDLRVYIAARVAAAVAVEGAIAVPARALVDWVRALPTGTVRLVLAAKAARVKTSSGRATAALVCLAADEFPSPPALGGAAEVALDARWLRRALGRVLPAVRAGDDDPALGSVCLTPGADGLRLAAADGSRLAQAVVAGAVSAPADPVLVPRRAAEDFSRALAVGDVARLQIGEARNAARLAVGRYEVFARLVEGRFPAVAEIIPKSAATRVAVETQGLRRALKLASFFGASGQETVLLDAAPGRLRLRAPDAGVGEGETELEAAFEGRPGRVAVDVPLLAELLREADAPVVTLAWEDAARPVVIREIADGGGHPDNLWLVMPLRHAAIAEEETAKLKWAGEESGAWVRSGRSHLDIRRRRAGRPRASRRSRPTPVPAHAGEGRVERRAARHGRGGPPARVRCPR